METDSTKNMGEFCNSRLEERQWQAGDVLVYEDLLIASLNRRDGWRYVANLGKYGGEVKVELPKELCSELFLIESQIRYFAQFDQELLFWKDFILSEKNLYLDWRNWSSIEFAIERIMSRITTLLEMAVAVIQAYVFCLLTAIYLGVTVALH